MTYSSLFDGIQTWRCNKNFTLSLCLNRDDTTLSLVEQPLNNRNLSMLNASAMLDCNMI